MDLFDSENDNLLPFDGTVLYHRELLSAAEADRFFDRLRETIAWQSDEVIVFGEAYPIMEVAKDIGTIPYEVLTNVSRRVKRVYYQE